mmetsp:Transcript_17998/g.20745  ORF Transcript_17998/g.20745 Transcript_17998/m.20745 type:complete len:92 (-) Transcript_17998:1529-1804(-)
MVSPHLLVNGNMQINSGMKRIRARLSSHKWKTSRCRDVDGAKPFSLLIKLRYESGRMKTSMTSSNTKIDHIQNENMAMPLSMDMGKKANRI